MKKSGLLLIGLLLAQGTLAAPGIEALTVTPGEGGEQTYTLTIQVLLMMTALSMLPAALILMTSFTRIVIVLVDPSPGTGDRADTVQSDSHRAGAVPDLFHHGACVERGV